MNRQSRLTFSPVMSYQFHLCYITDRHGLGPASLPGHIQAAARAGVDLIQLREKDMPSRELAELASGAVEAARGRETRIVVNDRLDIAMAAGADGVHLGGQSAPPEVVRSHAEKSFLVGVSCHSPDDAIRAEASGADYVLLGPIFDTPSKRRYGPPLGLNQLSEAANRIRIPLLALGGITAERVRLCLEAGATGIAAIRLFQECSSIEDLVRELRDQFS